MVPVTDEKNRVSAIQIREPKAVLSVSKARPVEHQSKQLNTKLHNSNFERLRNLAMGRTT